MPKEFTFGNTKVTVYSPLAQMSKEEQKAFFKAEWEKGNLILREIAQAAHECLVDQISPPKLEKYS